MGAEKDVGISHTTSEWLRAIKVFFIVTIIEDTKVRSGLSFAIVGCPLKIQA